MATNKTDTPTPLGANGPTVLAASAPLNRVIKVEDNLHYAKIEGSEEAILINEGVTDFTQALSPESDPVQYIGEANKRNNMKGYAPTVTYASTLNPSDPFNVYLYTIGKEQKVAQTFIEYEVETWNPGSTEGTFVAYQHTYEVQPANPGSGAGGDNLKLEGSLSQIGKTIKGTFNISTKAFVADTNVTA